ncbi:phage minor head protein [Escherichia albertii]|nr:phage minor head protein [Escherichia albertii]
MPTADDVDLGYAYTLKPEEAIKYFESKGYVIGFRWHDVKDIANARAFTVAGVLKLDVLKDIRDGLTAALADGGTFREFAAQLEPLLEKKGWLGKRLIVDEDTGELYGRQLTPRRLRTIFDTNIQSSYNAGRYQQQMANVADRPYFERVAVMDLHTRPKHAALNGFTARADDPVWEYFYVPDGYGCRCRIRARSASDVEKYGLTVQSSEGRLLPAQEGWAKDYASRDINGFKSWLDNAPKLVALSQTQTGGKPPKTPSPAPAQIKTGDDVDVDIAICSMMGVDPEDVARYAGDE